MSAPWHGGHRMQDLAWVSLSSLFFVWLTKLCCNFSAHLKENLALPDFQNSDFPPGEEGNGDVELSWGLQELSATEQRWGKAGYTTGFETRLPSENWDANASLQDLGRWTKHGIKQSCQAQGWSKAWKGGWEMSRELKNSSRAWLSCGWVGSC